MGAFAFDAALLRRPRLATSPRIWHFEGHGGESELVEQLLGPQGGAPV